MNSRAHQRWSSIVNEAHGLRGRIYCSKLLLHDWTDGGCSTALAWRFGSLSNCWVSRDPPNFVSPIARLKSVKAYFSIWGQCPFFYQIIIKRAIACGYRPISCDYRLYMVKEELFAYVSFKVLSGKNFCLWNYGSVLFT